VLGILSEALIVHSVVEAGTIVLIAGTVVAVLAFVPRLKWLSLLGVAMIGLGTALTLWPDYRKYRHGVSSFEILAGLLLLIGLIIFVAEGRRGALGSTIARLLRFGGDGGSQEESGEAKDDHHREQSGADVGEQSHPPIMCSCIARWAGFMLLVVGLIVGALVDRLLRQTDT
jgi:drug/metabolite transporter (DMT)-like permease